MYRLKIIYILFSITLLSQSYQVSAFAWGMSGFIGAPASSNNAIPAASSGGKSGSTPSKQSGKLYICSVSTGDAAASKTLNTIKTSGVNSLGGGIGTTADTLAGIITDQKVSPQVKNDAVQTFIQACGGYRDILESSDALYTIATDRNVSDSLKVSLFEPLLPSIQDSLPSTNKMEGEIAWANNEETIYLLSAALQPINSNGGYKTKVETMLSDLGYINQDNRGIWENYNMLVYKNDKDGNTEITAIQDTLALFPPALLPKGNTLCFLTDSAEKNIMDDKTGGTYWEGGIICLNSDLLKENLGGIYYRQALAHEIGHNIYHTMLSTEKKEEWNTLFTQSFKDGSLDQAACVIPGEAKNKNADEDFAYTLGYYMTNSMRLLKETINTDNPTEYNSPLIDKINYLENLFTHISPGASMIYTYAYRPNYQTKTIERYETTATDLRTTALLSEQLGVPGITAAVSK